MTVMKYKNPIIPGFHPDPSICRVGEDFYLVTSSFEYFPGVPIFHSRDLVHWKQIGHCLTRRSQLNLDHEPSSGGLYAPTIRYHNGLFYMVTTHISHGNFYVFSEDPAGEWSDPIWLQQKGIDPSLFFDDDDNYNINCNAKCDTNCDTSDCINNDTAKSCTKVYLTSSCGIEIMQDKYGIYQCELDIQTGCQLTPSRLIWQGTGGAYPEAPHLYKINDIYYLMISEGGTEHGHMVTIARSLTPYGPFEACPSNPVLTHRSLHTPIKAVGHADLVQTQNGGWWAVCLGIRPIPYPWRHHLGRETFLTPVKWGDDGWPVFGDNGVIHPKMDAGLLPQAVQRLDYFDIEKVPIRDDFDKGSLDFHWNFIRTPNDEDWSLSQRKGFLTLNGSASSLDGLDSPAFVGRRQEHFNCTVRALLDFKPAQEGEEAGLTVFLCEKFHYEIAVQRLNETRSIIFRRRLGSLWKSETCFEFDESDEVPVILEVCADEENYTFSYTLQKPGTAEGPDEPVVVGKGECACLSTEVGGKFTGVFFGIYSTGNGKKCSSPAYFDWFDYIPASWQWELKI